MLLFSAAAAAPAPVMPAPPIILSAPAKHDVQCFMLYAIAVQGAVEKNDEKVKQAGGLGVMYFFTKLKVEAPKLDLFETIKQQAVALKGGPELDAIARAATRSSRKRGRLFRAWANG